MGESISYLLPEVLSNSFCIYQKTTSSSFISFHIAELEVTVCISLLWVPVLGPLSELTISPTALLSLTKKKKKKNLIEAPRIRPRILTESGHPGSRWLLVQIKQCKAANKPHWTADHRFRNTLFQHNIFIIVIIFVREIVLSLLKNIAVWFEFKINIKFNCTWLIWWFFK